MFEQIFKIMSKDNKQQNVQILFIDSDIRVNIILTISVICRIFST